MTNSRKTAPVKWGDNRKQSATGRRQLRHAANNIIGSAYHPQDIQNATGNVLLKLANFLEFGQPYSESTAEALRGLAKRIDTISKL